MLFWWRMIVRNSQVDQSKATDTLMVPLGTSQGELVRPEGVEPPSPGSEVQPKTVCQRVTEDASRLRNNSIIASYGRVFSNRPFRVRIASRMRKKPVQQGRSEGRGEAYASVRWASERCENATGGLFPNPARGVMGTLADVLLPDGSDVNLTLVKEGWCRRHQKYAEDTVLEGG